MEAHRDRLIYVPGVVAVCKLKCPVCDLLTEVKTPPKSLSAPGGDTVISLGRIEDLINVVMQQLVNGTRDCESCGVPSKIPKKMHQDVKGCIKRVLTISWLMEQLAHIADELPSGSLTGAQKTIEKFIEKEREAGRLPS